MTAGSFPTTSLAPVLERFLVESGLSQSELARRAGFAQSVISRILGRKVLSVQSFTIARLAEAMGVRPSQLLEQMSAPAPPDHKVALDLGRLPIPGPHFVGRQAELARLDAAWAAPAVHVFTLVAFGGVGKSALVARWLDGMAADGWRGARRVLAWSFYSQGTEYTNASAETFVAHALRFFGDSDPAAGSPHDRGARLAGLVRQERTLLILDGLEPLQHGPGRPEVAGRLKDPGMAALLKSLAASNPGLCVVTTREHVADLAGWKSTAPQVDLETLEPEAAVELLRVLGVRGSNEELGRAAAEFQGHALTLTLLGNYLRRVHGGDGRKLRDVELRKIDEKSGGHAGRVIAAYCRWLGAGPEVAILRLLGFFDRPADAASIEALRAKPVIKGLTEALVGLSKEDWQRAVTTLREHGLIAEADPREPEALDAHPLVRAFFAAELENEKEQSWAKGNLRLYQHLCREVPDLPETLEQMQPLYAAILHGCRAGLHQEVMTEVYWRRILRKNESFSTRKLGAFGSELAALAGFFDRPWSQPSARLTAGWHAFVLNQAAFHLRALGRPAEAVEPMHAGLAERIAQEDWQNAAISANNLGELTLTLGDVPGAVAFGEQSVEMADRTADAFRRLTSLTTWADALHQAGWWEKSLEAFRNAESMQAKRQPAYPRLYSLAGFRYCDLLLSLAEPETGAGLDGLAALRPDWTETERLRQNSQEVLERANQTLAWIERADMDLLSIALDNLSLGRALLHTALLASEMNNAAKFSQAAEHLNRAVDGLRRAGAEEFVARGLLARAGLRRHLPDHPGAEADLAEVLEIAELGGMRLLECDAHLELARLRRDQGKSRGARRHWARAEESARAMGYARRYREVAWLKESLMRDFFVSFNSKDRPWADWIAWTLEEAGFSVVYQPWDFRPGANFVLEMQKAASEARKTVMVLSDNYLRADYTQPEWAAAFVDDPRGEKRKLIPVRVAPCSPEGMLKPLIWADLVGLTPDAAQARLLAAVSDDRPKPASPPSFPGAVVAVAGAAPAFPGGGAKPAAVAEGPATHRTELLAYLKRLPSAQFEELVFHYDIGAHLPGKAAAQAERAVELLRALEARDSGLTKLATDLETLRRGGGLA